MIDERQSAAVLWLKGSRHKLYEDRFRLLTRDIPIVRQRGAGELLAVADGVGSAPMGMQAAQHLCDALLQYVQTASECAVEQLLEHLARANVEVNRWGCIEATSRPLGACAATVVLIDEQRAQGWILHAGDTRAALIRNGTGQLLTALDQGPDGELVRYFGQAGLQLQATAARLEPGDRLLLVSDGVTKSLTMSEAVTVVEQHATRAASLRSLGQACLRADSGDDITALLMDIDDD